MQIILTMLIIHKNFVKLNLLPIMNMVQDQMKNQWLMKSIQIKIDLGLTKIMLNKDLKWQITNIIIIIMMKK